ncbi:hypothetical protein [Haloquadratum walsbyi]|uniref:Uncharacterized protein n=1 Tax=Haloquadratum walsbyi J07HQW2 TaxID=1238425 RepID=U1MV24_9EURY|nr:hypothetical protein [Haloquadratum walsbyi]ERG94254.1 MAG: hypothetical protein J07HQW2_00688 [Haloquadratum walsbyi J07HQW2]
MVPDSALTDFTSQSETHDDPELNYPSLLYSLATGVARSLSKGLPRFRGRFSASTGAFENSASQ